MPTLELSATERAMIRARRGSTNMTEGLRETQMNAVIDAAVRLENDHRWPTTPRLAKECGVSHMEAVRAVNDADRKGLWRWNKRPVEAKPPTEPPPAPVKERGEMGSRMQKILEVAESLEARGEVVNTGTVARAMGFNGSGSITSTVSRLRELGHWRWGKCKLGRKPKAHPLDVVAKCKPPTPDTPADELAYAIEATRCAVGEPDTFTPPPCRCHTEPTVTLTAPAYFDGPRVMSPATEPLIGAMTAVVEALRPLATDDERHRVLTAAQIVLGMIEARVNTACQP